jgi:hypothetical protein
MLQFALQLVARRLLNHHQIVVRFKLHKLEANLLET